MVGSPYSFSSAYLSTEEVLPTIFTDPHWDVIFWDMGLTSCHLYLIVFSSVYDPRGCAILAWTFICTEHRVIYRFVAMAFNVAIILSSD